MSIIKGSKKAAGNVPQKAGAYSLSVTQQGIRMTGYDDEGLFYAAQTLLQLAEKTPSGVTVPVVEVLDWPDVPFRGTIEGFYGLPWGQEGRISQFKFYGKYKMNTYIYGPKDDVFHGFSKRWREPYPARTGLRAAGPACAPPGADPSDERQVDAMEIALAGRLPEHS